MLTREELQSLLLRNLPIADHHGEIIEEVGPSSIRMRLPVLESYLSQDLPPGSGRKLLSGAIEMGFAETVMYACIHSVYGVNVFVSTLTFNSVFLSPAGEGDLVARARILRKGKSVAFVEAQLFSGSAEEPCAQVTASYSITTTLK